MKWDAVEPTRGSFDWAAADRLVAYAAAHNQGVCGHIEWFAYSEGQESSQFIVSPKSISVLHMRRAQLRSQALSPGDSRSLLERMRGAP